MQNSLEQARIQQLISTYGPDEPPRMRLDFGDFLSLLWRIDKHAEQVSRARYYRQCAFALAQGLGLKGRSLYRLIELSQPGEIYQQLANAPYRGTTRLIDAKDRKAAITQLVQLRDNILRIGTFQEGWNGSWPGSGIIDTEVRERVFAVLFTALQGQFGNFGRLLLVVDIVLANLLLDFEPSREVSLQQLVTEHGYPKPTDQRARRDYYGDD